MKKLTQSLMVIAVAVLAMSMVEPSNAGEATAAPQTNDSFVESGVVIASQADWSEEVIASWPDDSYEASAKPDDGPEPVAACCLVDGDCYWTTNGPGGCDDEGGAAIDCDLCPS